MRIPLVILLATVVMVAGCSRAPVITIANQSSVTLSNLVVSGSGFSARVGEIAAGRKRKLTVLPSGESGVRVVFDAGGNTLILANRLISRLAEDTASQLQFRQT